MSKFHLNGPKIFFPLKSKNENTHKKAKMKTNIYSNKPYPLLPSWFIVKEVWGAVAHSARPPPRGRQAWLPVKAGIHCHQSHPNPAILTTDLSIPM